MGRPLDEETLDLVPPKIANGQMRGKTQCCWVYDVNWNGRWIPDVFCSTQKDDTCIPNIKIVRSAIYRHCLKETMMTSVTAMSSKHFAPSINLLYLFNNLN